MISYTLTGVKESLAFFDPKKVRRAITNSLMVTAKSARTAASSKIRESYNILKRDLDKGITVRRASDMAVNITAKRKWIPLIKFGHPTWNRLMTGAQVQVKIGTTQMYPHTFIATMKSGHTGIFHRRSDKFMQFQKSTWKKKRQAISETVGPTVMGLFGDKVVMDAVEAKLKEVSQTNLNHAITWEIFNK